MVLQISPSPLTQSLSLPFSGKVAPNRLVKAAMTERLCRDSADRDQLGRPSPELFRLYEEWSHGDYGVIVTGNILVDRNHLEAKGNAVIDKDAPFHFEEDYAHLATIAKGRASLVIAQLNHPGGQCSKNLQENPVAPSDIQCPPALGAEFNKPTSLTDAGVLDIIDRFVFAAGVLYRAGFDGVQLHAAHGYILTQFLSPRTNKRTDRWGGDLEGRSRIIFEIVKGIQRVTAPEFSVSVKLNSQDYISDGFTTTDCQELIVGLEKARVDFIELSGGTYESLTDAFQYKSESTRKREAFFIDFAETVQAQVKETKILVTGGFRHRASMEDAVASGAADLVGLARTLTAEPRIGRSLLSRQVDGCRANLLPDHIGLGIAASNVQILDIGFGREPTDYAKVENVNAFLKALGLA